MFGDEKAEWNKFFDFYKKKFNEEVGLFPGVFENDDFEIDLVVGEDSGKVHGIRVMQIAPYEEEDQEEEEVIIEGENDDEDEEEYGMICYDLVKTNTTLAKLKGKPYFDLNFGTKKKKKKRKDDDIILPEKIQIYSKMQDDNILITGAVMFNNSDDPEDITVLEETSELG
ncbi:MAG: hypothetical protein ACTSWX_11990 [Promethearchaeota archaeon]